jgi:hypothetical protein
MLRKMVIALAAASAITAGSMIAASAHGFGGHGGGFSHGGGGFHHGFAGGHPAFFHHGFHHRFFVNRFAFYGGGPYYDSCYRRVWTRWGWRWVSVCY